LLRATSFEAATDVLVRVKSHYLDVDMAKIKGGANCRCFRPATYYGEYPE
jgi:hypothetical protein